MSTKAKHRLLLLISLVVCGIVIGDSYLSPLKSSTEIIENHWMTSGRRYGASCYIATDKRSYSVPLPFYEEVSIGTRDTMIVVRSVLSNAINKLYLHDNGYIYPLDYSIMQTALGPVILLIAGLILLAFFLYDYIPSEQGRMNISIASLIFSIGMLVVYIFIA